MCHRYHTVHLSDGAWSPVRPGVFFTTKMDGTLDVWDLLYKHNEPSLSVRVTDEPLVGLRVHDHGRLVAVGSHAGTVAILELSHGLSSLQDNEKNIVSNVRPLHGTSDQTIVHCL